MRINTPKFQSKKEMFSYLKENKQTLIEQKKSMPIYSDCVNFGSTRIKVGGVAKANKPVDGDMDTLRVKVIELEQNHFRAQRDYPPLTRPYPPNRGQSWRSSRYI